MRPTASAPRNLARGHPVLVERIASRIRAEGPITFASFMEMALYEPGLGYYVRPNRAAQKDYRTSPQTDRAFGNLIARQLRVIWEQLDRPNPFVVAEFGGGDCT